MSSKSALGSCAAPGTRFRPHQVPVVGDLSSTRTIARKPRGSGLTYERCEKGLCEPCHSREGLFEWRSERFEGERRRTTFSPLFLIPQIQITLRPLYQHCSPLYTPPPCPVRLPTFPSFSPHSAHLPRSPRLTQRHRGNATQSRSSRQGPYVTPLALILP